MKGIGKRAGRLLRLAALILVPSSMAVGLFLLLWSRTSQPGIPTEVYGIPQYVSETDADGDGLDDQRDILASARAYLATGPRYGSRYYAGGYPDDGYGVCTDVVAFALKGAGYDLMDLVARDVQAHPEAYDSDCGDANIDFRRVRNLKVWFSRNALSLPVSLEDPADWQGGDIVIFRDHIGIVSDRRNKRGVPYVLHHYGRFQLNYEEDILEKRADLEMHFRVSGSALGCL